MCFNHEKAKFKSLKSSPVKQVQIGIQTFLFSVMIDLAQNRTIKMSFEVSCIWSPSCSTVAWRQVDLLDVKTPALEQSRVRSQL